MPNFVIFLMAGLLLWNLFSLGVLTGTGVVVNNAGIVKKVSFPREILALAAVGSACVFFFFQSVVNGDLHGPAAQPAGRGLLAAPRPRPVTGIVLASGLGILLSSVNVYLRDTQHLIEVVLTAWFWACPIVYAYWSIEKKLGPHGLTWVYFLNPVTPLVLTFQRCLYAHPPYTVNGVTTQVLPTQGYLWYAALVLGVLSSPSASSSSPSPSSAVSRAISPRSSDPVSDFAVDVRNISKRFRLAHGQYNSLKERIIHGGKRQPPRTSGPSTRCRSPCRRVRPSASSAATARASRPCSSASAASSSPRRARSPYGAGWPACSSSVPDSSRT